MNQKITSTKNQSSTKKLHVKKLIKKSQLLMVVMISVLAATLILSGTSHAYAFQSLGENPSIGRVGPDHFGLATKEIVCGDHLCQNSSVKKMQAVTEKTIKTITNSIGHSPSINTEQVYPYSKQADNSYMAIFKVTGGDKNLSKVQISVKSDLDKTTIPLDGLFTVDNQIVAVRIHATDPQSISATPISWQFNN